MYPFGTKKRPRNILAITLTYGFFVVLLTLQSGFLAPVRANGETISVWLTTPDKTNLLASQGALSFSSGGSNANAITINDEQTYQKMIGFGASLTDSSAWLISNKMSRQQRDQLMSDLFSPTNGIGLNFLRQPMGSSDMALPSGYEGTNAPGEYSYDDM